jgi:hypothetical protein
MTSALWTPLGSMIGVVVGGGLTFFSQRTVQRASERADARQRESGVAEARRAEQIEILTQFLGFVYEAEGAAHARPAHWTVGDDWYKIARPAMDGLRIAEDTVKLVCALSLSGPVTVLSRAFNHVVWQERGEVTIAEYLQPAKQEFLAAARSGLD